MKGRGRSLVLPPFFTDYSHNLPQQVSVTDRTAICSALGISGNLRIDNVC